MERALAEYLTHAPVFIRTFGGEIVYWTLGAQELYGYTPSQARGKLSHDLLKTVFPEPLAEIERKLRDHGEWTGRLQHTRRATDEPSGPRAIGVSVRASPKTRWSWR